MEEARLISRDAFSTWYSPALTLGLLSDRNFENVARDAHPALVSGRLSTAAATLTVAGAALHLCRIPAGLWATWDARADLRFWATGNLVRPMAGQDAAISAYGVRFDPDGLSSLFPQLATRPQEVEAVASSAKGGRPAGKNGEPIAMVARQLLGLFAAELATYTTEAVAVDLVAQYRQLGLQPPSPDNARRDAAGILRAVRN